MKRRAIAAVMVLVCGVAHAKDVSIYQNVDEFKGFTQYFTDMDKTKVDGGGFLSLTEVRVQFRTVKPVPTVPYSLRVRTSTQGWLFIKNGESLVLKVDGVPMPLSGPGSIANREVIYSDLVAEEAYYDLTADQLAKLAGAQVIEYRVYGDKAYIQGKFSDKNMAELKFFAQKAPELNGLAAPAAPAAPTPR